MKTLLSALLLATALTAGGVAVATADPAAPDLRLAPVPTEVEDEGPGTDQPRYGCVAGVCDTRGESDEGPGTTG